VRSTISTSTILASLATIALPLPASAASLLATAGQDGTLVIKDEQKVVATFSPKTPAAQRGPVGVREIKVAGHTVLEARIPVRGDGPKREEAWVAERTAADVKVIWWDLAGDIDPDGENRRTVEITDQGVEEYQTAARLSRCDGAPVKLFRRTWSFATRSFRPAPPDLPARGDIVVRARRSQAPEGKPLGGFYFSAASATAGAGNNATHLRPPAAVNDGDPKTVWAADSPSPGQLLTARSSGGFAVTGLRLLPGDTSTEARYLASAKPKRLAIILGRDQAQNIEVELDADNLRGVRDYLRPFWIPLPKPVTTHCVSVVVRDTTSDKTPVSIADLEVMTELDGPEAADRLVSSLAQGTSCAARTPLLVRLGPAALAKVNTALATAAPSPGRACLVVAVDELLAAKTPATPETAAALVAAIADATPDEEKTILKLLPTLPEIPVAAVKAILLDDKRSDEDRTRAARVLSAIDRDDARAGLFAATGHGSPGLRKALRSLLAKLPAATLAAVLAQLESTPRGESARRADLLSVVGPLAAKGLSLRAEARAALRAPLEGEASFEERGRAIQGLGLILDPPAVEALIAVRVGSTDAVLRGLAIGELANANGPAVLSALRAALEDADPLVRESAASALGRKGDEEAAKPIIAGAKQEPWPSVRKAEITALGQLCTPEGKELLLRAFKKDVEEVRQAALVAIADCYQAKATGTLLGTLGRLAESADMRQLAARLLAARKDPRTVPGLTEVMSRLLRESEADLSLEGVIADTAMALAAIRTDQAIASVAGLLSDKRPSVQCIGIETLATVCDPGAGAAALQAATKDKDESVATRASAALVHCRDKPQ
jgi:HEAT repeat protein